MAAIFLDGDVIWLDGDVDWAAVEVNPDALVLELDLLGVTIGGTVYPDALVLELDLQTPVVGGFLIPTTLELELELLMPLVGVSFPTLSSYPKIEGFIDEYSDETIVRDSYASGYPLINPYFSFDPKNYSYVMRFMSQADKESLSTFYRDNKVNKIFWPNEQDDNTYLVIFTRKPSCELDGANNKWKMDLGLRQVAEV